MKTIPSLVASSTVGVAAVGLAFGKQERHSPPRPSSKKRKVVDLADLDPDPHIASTPISRPGTSSTAITPDSRVSRRPTRSSPSAPNAPIIHQQRSTSRANGAGMSGGRRLSVVKSGEFAVHESIAGDEFHRRDSISSRGSWMRRLSSLPSSHNSPRSSVGPDTPSINPSNASAAPILTHPTSSPTQLPPNKLVKRATSGRASSDSPNSLTRSKTSLPTLRRPATSHQRSVTLQQQFKDDAAAAEKEQRPLETPTKQENSTPPRRFYTPESRNSWRQYFESRTTRLTKEKVSGFSSDGGAQNFQSTSKRVVQDEIAKPILMKPEMITSSEKSDVLFYDDSFDFDGAVEDEGANDIITPSLEPLERQKRARRSLSLHFSSPVAWATRTGSSKGKLDDAAGRGKRYPSAPVSTVPRSTTSHGERNRVILNPTISQRQRHTSAENSSPNDPFELSFEARSRNSPSPLPPLSRLSSFNLDLARLGLSSSSSAPRNSPGSPLPQTITAPTSIKSSQTSPNLSLYLNPFSPRPSQHPEFPDRASTLVGSDNDTKGFASGDEDDMDFQSETVFDSLRSGATNSVRSHHSPLDSMFDETPPSLNVPPKTKRLSIHEMLVNGGFQEGDARILEEDEGMPTPVKGSISSPREDSKTPLQLEAMMDIDGLASPPSFSLATKDFSRLSLDDEDDDEDWTRDDENLDVGNLSPPSSMNSRKVSPSIRAALADVTHSGSTNGISPPAERPKSNVFDWAEPSSTDKLDHLGNSPRPKTAHVKQHADGRGGRTIGRRGPTALHVRSQSVPVVPDLAGQRDSKMTPKFGTWGLGAKGVSEDWDNDFDFEGIDMKDVEDGESKMENSGMLVPPAIQASQANIVGHVGQIREVCLLVEDLKRLRMLAKERNLLEGRSAALWKEAEGIIALAVPDEEEDTTMPPPRSPSLIASDYSDIDDNYQDEGPDGADLAMPEAPFEMLDRRGGPTGYFFDGTTVRRRSVFSPDDDIFGAGNLNTPSSRDYLCPPSASNRSSGMRSPSDIARTVMETMHQHRATSDPLLRGLTSQASNKMPFDTTSLRDLVHRANVLTRTLSDLINKADGVSQSPEASPKRESSPAFTRVFTDPMQSPPRHLPRSQSNNSVLSGSIDSSPTRSLGQRLHMMTVV